MKTIAKMLIALTFGAASLTAQAKYPDRPIRLIVPFAPGGNIDASARIVARGLTRVLGESIVVENRPGAGGIVGSEYVARAKPDGYTCLLGSTGALATAKVIHPHLKLNPAKDFVAASAIARAPLILVVSPSMPVKNVAQFIAYAKARPGKLTVASSGIGTAAYLTAALFEKLSGTKLLQVPYQGSAPAISALLGGNVDLTFDQPASTLALIRAGKLHALGVTTAKRSGVLPSLPTLAETGLPGFESSTTTGLLFPVGTPVNVIQKVHAAMQQVLAMPSTKKEFQNLGSDVLGPHDDFGRILAHEVKKWEKVGEEASINAS